MKPESMLNYEVSLRQRLLDNCLDMGVAFFLIDAKDMIQTVMSEGSPLNVNTGKFINKGFEIDAAYRFNSWIRLSANYAYLHTSSTDLLYAPKNKLDVQLDVTPRNFEITLSNNNIWSLNTGNPDGNVNYSLLNLRVAYKYHAKGITVKPFVKLDDINNKRYEVVYGCPMPGFTIMGGVEASF